ncbi:hypothetical protein WHZ77_09495 [Bradyrhizobium sp. A5]|uniref:hypothetical protein n=1 Tax=Bradyrhizobium sp. A5 TaxID=3133696 RepID=UPI00324D084F
MLSRLISLLRRIPAVKWAFTRLRPLPHSGSIDVAPTAAADSTAADIAEATPALDSIVAEPLQCDAETVAVKEVSVSTVEREPVDAPELVNDDPAVELPANGEPADEEEAPALPAETTESKRFDAAEPVISNQPSFEAPIKVEPAAAEEVSVSSVDVAIAAVDALAPIVSYEPSSGAVVDAEPIVLADACVALADGEVSTPDIAGGSIESDPSPSVAAEIEPVSTRAPAPVAALAAEATPSAITHVAPEPVLAPPAPKISSAPKARAKIADPVDRAMLIRQRWAETGIRMWNPRLHGTGDATLNIQGRVELLPPAPGETMPRYDKLEFRMLGGQIVCEGIIVEAPAHGGQRNFTRLAEPGKTDRVREPVGERQAVLA